MFSSKTAVLTICPKCNKRHEIGKSNERVSLNCVCGEMLTVEPWVFCRKILTEQDNLKCPECGRFYVLQGYRPKTEISCSCGKIVIVTLSAKEDKTFGRRKSDKELYLKISNFRV
jgi:hypothetical protein